MNGKTLRSLMRKHGVKISDFAERWQQTRKRIREILNGAADDNPSTLSEWSLMIREQGGEDVSSEWKIWTEEALAEFQRRRNNAPKIFNSWLDDAWSFRRTT